MNVVTIRRAEEEGTADTPMIALQDHIGARGQQVRKDAKFFATPARAAHLVERGLAAIDWPEESEPIPDPGPLPIPVVEPVATLAEPFEEKVDKRSKAYRQAHGRSR